MSEHLPPRRSLGQRAIADAVTTELARAAAQLWEESAQVPEPIPAVQNFVFAISRKGRPAILRLTHESHRGPSQVEAELRWLLDLGQRGLPAAQPYRSESGNLVEMVESKHGRFVVTCFERFAGAAPDPENAVTGNDAMFENLGSLMARLHEASRAAEWKAGNLLRPTWRDESVVRTFHSLVPASEKKIHVAYDRLQAELEALPQTPSNFGLIHADLNHANFFLAPDGLKLFDFDDSGFSWFAYDLIVPIFHFPAAVQAEMDAAATRAFAALRRGYERISPLPLEWLQWLPLFLRWRDVITYGFFYEQLEMGVLPASLRRTFLAMQARVESGRLIAEISDAR